MVTIYEKCAPEIIAVKSTLNKKYKDFSHNNRKNPLEELLFIICSVKTANKSYEAMYHNLRREFPRFGMIAEAPVDYIAQPLMSGGLQRKKSKNIKAIIDRITKEFGKPTLAPLKKMPDEECEKFLMSLPGVGKKVARCVMLYSLGRDVFPVDTHCWRICQRLGWIVPASRGRHCSPKDMDRLQEMIPSNYRFSLHVNMISLGREICSTLNPKCEICPINDYCLHAKCAE